MRETKHLPSQSPEVVDKPGAAPPGKQTLIDQLGLPETSEQSDRGVRKSGTGAARAGDWHMTADLSTAIGLGGAEPAIGGSQRGHVATKPPALQMSGSRWSTMKKGAGIYFGITLKDEGSAYAKALMRHYLLGGGKRVQSREELGQLSNGRDVV